MSRRNSICKKCGSNFHACSSCGLYYDWEYQYCSERCYMMSDEAAAVERTSRNIAAGVSLEVVPLLIAALEEWEDPQQRVLRDILSERLKENCEAA